MFDLHGFFGVPTGLQASKRLGCLSQKVVTFLREIRVLAKFINTSKMCELLSDADGVTNIFCLKFHPKPWGDDPI